MEASNKDIMFDMEFSARITSTSVGLDSDMPASLLTVIHTEEEFDWNLPFDRTKTGIQHLEKLHVVQNIFDKHKVKPTYLLDYPVASRTLSKSIFGDLLTDQLCEIGTHLHPWVSPPLIEYLCNYNSYPGNLRPETEAEKLGILTAEIESRFEITPRTYLAGRYGYGPNTGRILGSLGYTVDLSLVPAYNYSDDGGPDGSLIDNNAQWSGENLELLRLPHTAAYIGPLARRGFPWMERLSQPKPVDEIALKALGRARLLRRVRLSPEGSDLATMKRLTRHLHRIGVRIFVFSFHSPSIVPGNTPYVRSERELASFLETIENYIDFFKNELAGEFVTPQNLYSQLKSKN